MLTVGNSAKLYCLNWIEAHIARSTNEVTLLDLGCGTGNNFVRLLQAYPQVRYVGIEPSATAAQARRNLNGLNATIFQDYAYDVYGRLVQEQFDIVVSFSVLEHVYRRQAYLQAAKDCLKPNGHFLINYDAGHFIAGNRRDWLKNQIGPLLARLGNERYYQAFVREADFRAMAQSAGLRIVDAKSFNTRLKSVFKAVPPAHQDNYMRHWLDFELYLNTLDIDYDDTKAVLWFTRNFILQPAS
jgi:SAM-dependent methyltransferase